MITFEDFTKVDIRTGTIVEIRDFPKARKPAYRLKIDFGPLGIKQSSAQITELYTEEELLGKTIIAVVNFAPKQIDNFLSECLVLGLTNKDGAIVLLQTSVDDVNNGEQIS
jgi:tRNA-binding protein